MANLKVAVGVISKGKRLIEIKHYILVRTSFNHALTISNFYLLPKSNKFFHRVIFASAIPRLVLKVVNIN